MSEPAKNQWTKDHQVWLKHMQPLTKSIMSKLDQLGKKEGWGLFYLDEGIIQIQALDAPEELNDGYLKERDGEAYTLCCQCSLSISMANFKKTYTSLSSY